MNAKKILIVALTLTWTAKAQKIDIQDLNDNNGYLPIKTNEFKTINRYDKTLHLVNLTSYEETISLISDNINVLETITIEDGNSLKLSK